jgi:hypothetical protein
VLLSDISDGHIFPLAIPNRETKDLFGQENPLGVMAKTPMSNICHDGFRLIEPLVNAQIIVRDAAESAGAIFCVFQGMSHGLDLPGFVGVADDFIPMVLYANQQRFEIERNRSEAALAVFVAFGCEAFQEITECLEVEINRQPRFLDGNPCHI